jgi:hypothetical protein
MKLPSGARRALFVVFAAAALAPARAGAQETEAWVLPRGLLELSGGGLFMDYDSRLGFGGPALGSELLEPLRLATDRATAGHVAGVQTRLADFFASTTDPEAGALPDSLTAGTLGLRLTGDVRVAPLTARYGLSNRLTVFVTVPIERRGTSAVGPYLLGGTLGINPNPSANANLLAEVDPRFGDLGGGLLLPVSGTPEAVELQSRLRAISPADTLSLPDAPVTVAELLGSPLAAAQLTAEEAAALTLTSARRPYGLGDVQLGARFLLRRGPAGWPLPDSVTGRSFRTAIGARVRLPTGRGGVRFLTEIPPGNGHFGVGLDVLNDIFLSRQWYVNASASVDVLFPAEVQRLAFSAMRPFPADSAVRTVRREPGPRLAVSITPRWRLTDEISFSGEYGLLAQGRTEYTGGEEGLLQTPLEWRTGGSVHSLGVGARYSSLQAFARGRANVPFEVTLTVGRAIAGGGAAPNTGMVRLTGRVFVDPRRFARLLPGGDPPADTLAQPPAAPPADTLPSEVRPTGPVVVPPQPDTTGVDSVARPPAASPQAGPQMSSQTMVPSPAVDYPGFPQKIAPSPPQGANKFAAGNTQSPPARTRRPDYMRRSRHLRVRNPV